MENRLKEDNSNLKSEIIQLRSRIEDMGNINSADGVLGGIAESLHGFDETINKYEKE